MKTKLTGAKLLRTAVNQILDHPETWDQTKWHSPCGTKHCIAGWCQILSGAPVNEYTVIEDAQKALGITDFEASVLFAGSQTLGKIYNFAKVFDRAGFDREGLDRDGKKPEKFVIED